QAGVEIAADIGSEFAVSLSAVLVDMIGEALKSYFPDLVTGVLGGGLIGGGALNPLGDLLAGGLNTLLTPLLGGLGGGISTMLLGLLGGIAGFDEGGLAVGAGMLPKATVKPERVLSPQQTA